MKILLIFEYQLGRKQKQRTVEEIAKVGVNSRMFKTGSSTAKHELQAETDMNSSTYLGNKWIFHLHFRSEIILEYFHATFRKV